MTAVLLDTHVIVWWQAGGQRLSRTAMRAIHTADVILVSPLSCWEIASLQRLGRLSLDREPARWVRDLLREDRVTAADLSPEAAVWAVGLGDAFPGDPIDRLLYATARDHRAAFVSKDERLRDFAGTQRDVATIW